jgi:hypothetical protein
MQRGWIRLWRKSLESRVFHNPGLWKVWTWCLLKAAYTERWATVKTGRSVVEVELAPGEFVFGRNVAAQELEMAPSTVRNRMRKLEKLRNVDIKEDTHYSIVSIVNWPSYQGEVKKEDRREDSQRTTKGHIQEIKEVREGTLSNQAGTIYSAYPRKADRKNSIKAIMRLLKEGVPGETLLNAVENYRAHIEHKVTDRDFIIQSNNFFGRAGRWEDWAKRGCEGDQSSDQKERPYQMFEGGL